MIKKCNVSEYCRNNVYLIRWYDICQTILSYLGDNPMNRNILAECEFYTKQLNEVSEVIFEISSIHDDFKYLAEDVLILLKTLTIDNKEEVKNELINRLETTLISAK